MLNPTNYQEALKLNRELMTRHDNGGTELRLVLAGNANFDFLAPALRVVLAANGFKVVMRSAAYGNWISETFGGTNAERDDLWVVWLSGMGASRGMTERPDIDVSSIAAAAQRLVDRGIKVVLIHPEPLISEDDPFSPFVAWRRGVIEKLAQILPPQVVQLSIEHLVRRLGTASWMATRYWEQAKAPCHPDAVTAVGSEVAAVITRMLRPAVRAVAVDLDDTIWGGLVGEVGPEGLDLDPEETGRPFIELQRLLLDLVARGIPIAVVSKNDEDVARRPFLERPEMLLSIDSFVRFDASWRPKCEAITALAQQLNIGVDAICFLDDSAKERDEARQMVPGLIVPELSNEPDKRVADLLRSRLFLTPVVSEEDRLRVEFFKRAVIPAVADLDEYLSSLGMILDTIRVDASNIDRTLSLLHKTNQFNLTLRRPSPAELTDFIADSSNYAYTYRLKDRVGDAGIIAVLLAKVQDGNVSIVGWVLSCRVFNRGVEWAIAEHFATWVHSLNSVPVVAPFTVGPRNALVRDVLASIGFNESVTKGNVKLFTTKSLTPPKHYIKIVER
jgi:FkbH-like protein